MLQMFTQSFKDSGYNLGEVSGGEVLVLLLDISLDYATQTFKQSAINGGADFVFNWKIQETKNGGSWLMTGDLYRKV